MFKPPKKITIALPEKIGNPDLFTGRKKEFDFFFGDWYHYMEGNFAPNQAIVSRRKKGKTAFMQRLFNILWSVGNLRKEDEPEVIPFYYSIRDSKQSLKQFALEFFNSFVAQYMSWEKRNEGYLKVSYLFEELPEIIDDKTIAALYKSMSIEIKNDNWQGMWKIASEAPSRIARLNNVKIIQIIDEFQYINEYIYDEDKEKLDGLSGTYMHVAELREAPLIVSGSEVHWLLKIVRSLTGRFQTYSLGNLPKGEAEEAVEIYAEASDTKSNNLTKEKIWELTRGDPLYIKALFLSRFNGAKDYTKDENIVDVYEKEISQGEIYTTWMEYMLNTFDSVNKYNSKRIILYLFNQEKERTRAEIIRDLKLPYTDLEAERKLNALIAGDLISPGKSAYDYTITKDKTYELVFKKVYQKEIEHFVPDIKAEIRKMIGKDNYIKGKFAEFLLREKLKNPFILSDVCKTSNEMKIVPKEIKEREVVSQGTRKYEIDLIIKCQKNIEIWIDVKDTKNRYGKNELNRWLRIIEMVREKNKDHLFMVYSKNGFTKGTRESLIKNDVYILKSE